MELGPMLFLLLFVTAKTVVEGQGVTKVTVEEGSDATLPCFLITKENIESKLFDWKKDGQKEVFLYDGGINYNNGRTGQDEQFKGRVSHFEEELKNGNASILITNTKLADSGNYSCGFPRLKPQGQIFYIELAVDRDPQRPTLKDQSGEISGAAPKPYITIINMTEDGTLLMCEVLRAFPRPTLEWQDSDGNVLPADQQQVSESRGHYCVPLLTTVTKRLRCVAKQEGIGHMTAAEIYAPSCERTVVINKWKLEPFGVVIGVVIGVVLTLVALAVCGAPKCITKRLISGSGQQETGPPHENGSPQELLPQQTTC